MFEPVGPDRMRVVYPIAEYFTQIPGVKFTIVIEPGYTFDGASIPRFAWSFIGAPFEPDLILAACIHDWFCDHSHESGRYQDRVIGDAVFFSLLEKAGVPRWRRVAMYLAVRLNSWWCYGRNSK